ncbi:MAG TPA: branched-chain amino acid ABC transporter permease [Chloroflexia bacterium]|nr:branched-chain amino acid ABC transporter permease [Chloroflexia bacterium]
MSLQVLVNGILLGGLLGLVGLGFSLVWGILNIVNLAHSAFIMLGAYLTFYLFDKLNLDPFLTLPVTMVLLFGLGFVVQKYLINRIIRAPLLVTFLLTFGLETLIVSLARVIFSGTPVRVSPSYSASGLELGDTVINYAKLAGVGVALVLTLLLYLFMAKTKTGNAIRAVSMDLNAARLMGIDIPFIYCLTYAISAALAAAAGTLLSIWLGSFTPDEFGIYNIRAFAVVVLGGLGSVPGALLGGLVFGILDQIASGVNLGDISLSAWKEGLIFIAMIVVLIVRPTGLLGKEGYR